MLERRTTGRCESGLSRARSTLPLMTTSSLPSSVLSSGVSIPVPASRPNSKDDMRKRGLLSPDRANAMAIAFACQANAATMNVESHAREHHRDLMTKPG
jgi:hypothetical protein